MQKNNTDIIAKLCDLVTLVIKEIIFDENIRFKPKVSQMGPKWDKSNTFSDQISVHFGSASHLGPI